MATDNEQVGAYIEALGADQKAICERLRALMGEIDGVEERFSWKRPVYRTSDGPLAYFVANKGWVSLGFDRGVDLSDPGGRLEGGGKAMRHLKIRSVDALDEDYCRSLLGEAAELGKA